MDTNSNQEDAEVSHPAYDVAEDKRVREGRRAFNLLYGPYKGRRDLPWVSDSFLFTLVMEMSFTGYLLAWDQKAYSATAAGMPQVQFKT